jgi:radical SAM superfamily enzyme YgiQ (UPF0313 family)
MKKILLVSPQSDNEALWITGDETAEVQNNMVPLSLATIAALTPKDKFQVRIWDENVHGLIDKDTDFGEDYDLVGFTGFSMHLFRCVDVARIFRNRGAKVVIGGPGISSFPLAFRRYFDAVFVNEAEFTWPQFLSDWLNGDHKVEYRQIEKPELSESPMPDFSSMAGDMCRYSMGAVQTTRGCPFDCEFCDVIFLFGRKPRHKPIPHVLDEIRRMADYGLKTIMLTDDEFSGDRRYAREMCHELIKLNASRPSPLTFCTQISLSISRDEDFLKLLSEANFDLVFVGIESANEESLLGANKVQNVKGGGIAEQVRRILSHGIGIRAGLIVGFDQDDTSIFEKQFRFIQDACLPSVAINMLKAPLGTKLWQRLMREQRVIDLSASRRILGHPRSVTNIIPKQMTRVELLEGYRWLLERTYAWDNFAERICGYASLCAHHDASGENPQVDAAELIAEFGTSPEAARAIEKVVEHTKRVTPHMMKKVKTLILQHARYFETVQGLIPQVSRQIELETQGRVVLKPDARLVPTPEEFRKSFNAIFMRVYRRLYVNLRDKADISSALTEVFVDFLVRWGEEFKGLEEHHVENLMELCDRTCASLNNTPPEEFVAIEDTEGAVPEVDRSRLRDDIFRNIWMELNEYYITGKRSAERTVAVPAPSVSGEAVDMRELARRL